MWTGQPFIGGMFHMKQQFRRSIEWSDLLKPAMEKPLSWVGEERVRPHRTTVYASKRLAAAHCDLESGKTLGKLVLRMD